MCGVAREEASLSLSSTFTSPMMTAEGQDWPYCVFIFLMACRWRRRLPEEAIGGTPPPDRRQKFLAPTWRSHHGGEKAI